MVWAVKQVNKAGEKQRPKGHHDKSLKTVGRGRKEQMIRLGSRKAGQESQEREPPEEKGGEEHTATVGSRCHHVQH